MIAMSTRYSLPSGKPRTLTDATERFNLDDGLVMKLEKDTAAKRAIFRAFLVRAGKVLAAMHG